MSILFDEIFLIVYFSVSDEGIGIFAGITVNLSVNFELGLTPLFLSRASSFLGNCNFGCIPFTIWSYSDDTLFHGCMFVKKFTEF